MTRQNASLIINVLVIGAGALIIGAALAQEAQPGATQPATETPEQIAARELCTETAAPGAYPGWAIWDGETCENSFAETCRIVRESDGAEATHACYEPLPMPEPESDADGEEVAKQ